MELKTTTTALVRRFGTTEGRLVLVEILFLLSTLAWVLLEMLGSYRRRNSHGFFCRPVWTVHTLSTGLAPYTIGLLQAGPFGNQALVLWGVVLLLIQIFLLLWLILIGNGGTKSYSATSWIFWSYSILLTYRNFIALGEMDLAGLLPTTPEYRVEVTNGKVITINTVWGWIDSQGFKYKDTAEVYKQTTLSCTLFKLLKHRFYGYLLGEAGLQKTLDFVLDGLLSEKGNYVGAFRVIEEELAFLYDFIYTRMKSNGQYWALGFPFILTLLLFGTAFLEHSASTTIVVIWNSELMEPM